jgi:hypothetical protein
MRTATGTAPIGRLPCRSDRRPASFVALRSPEDADESNRLADGELILTVARYVGTSVAMIDRTYGHLVPGSEQATVARMNARERLGHLWGTNEVGQAAR